MNGDTVDSGAAQRNVVSEVCQVNVVDARKHLLIRPASFLLLIASLSPVLMVNLSPSSVSFP